MRVVFLLPVEVSQEGAETPPGWKRPVVVATEMPLANHVRLVSGFVHVLGQQLPTETEGVPAGAKTNEKQTGATAMVYFLRYCGRNPNVVVREAECRDWLGRQLLLFRRLLSFRSRTIPANGEKTGASLRSIR